MQDFRFGEDPFDKGDVELKRITQNPDEYYKGEVIVGTDTRHGKGIYLNKKDKFIQ